jgi:phosphatidylserine/phosphatidylglycerophosphate/cardiolipin synthase-like enzyme
MYYYDIVVNYLFLLNSLLAVMVRYWINGIIIVLIAVATLYLVYELTASTTQRPIQGENGQHPGADRQVCFTPDDDCEAVIVRTINTAEHRVHVQAYLFTDEAIAHALMDAARRSIEVVVLVDKREQRERGSVVPKLLNAGVQVLLDDHPAIAHNKTIIIDPDSSHPTVETGSFNFTYSADHRNAENVLIVRNDLGLAAAYEQYFTERLAASKPWERGE